MVAPSCHLWSDLPDLCCSFLNFRHAREKPKSILRSHCYFGFSDTAEPVSNKAFNKCWFSWAVLRIHTLLPSIPSLYSSVSSSLGVWLVPVVHSQPGRGQFLPHPCLAVPSFDPSTGSWFNQVFVMEVISPDISVSSYFHFLQPLKNLFNGLILNSFHSCFVILEPFWWFLVKYFIRLSFYLLASRFFITSFLSSSFSLLFFPISEKVFSSCFIPLLGLYWHLFRRQ